MTLLEVVNGMEGVHFNGKDVIYIITLVISVLGGWFTMKGSIEKLKHRLEVVAKHIDSCQQDAKEESLAAKHIRIGIKKKVQEEIKDLTGLMNRRVDIVKNDLKEFQKDNANEINKLNDQITAIKTDTSEIKGMVQMLISNQQ